MLTGHTREGGVLVGPGLEEGLEMEDVMDAIPARDLGGLVGRTPGPRHVRLPPHA